jgi:hypothetical protein
VTCGGPFAKQPSLRARYAEHILDFMMSRRCQGVGNSFPSGGVMLIGHPPLELTTDWTWGGARTDTRAWRQNHGASPFPRGVTLSASDFGSSDFGSGAILVHIPDPTTRAWSRSSFPRQYIRRFTAVVTAAWCLTAPSARDATKLVRADPSARRRRYASRQGACRRPNSYASLAPSHVL